jgi:hypothetical protein
MSIINLTLQPPFKERAVLHDGSNHVNAIAVYGLFRNNASYLEYAFELFKRWEQSYDVEFYYYFLENDSKDATPTMLREFYKTHKGRLLSGNLSIDYVNKGENIERTKTLGHLRNTLVDSTISVVPSSIQWALFIDSNIYMQTDTLQRLFQHQPGANNIGLLSTYTVQIYRGSQLPELGLPPDTLVDLYHYFDTFAFVDNESQNHWPYCAFERCRFCPKVKPPTYTLPRNPATMNFVDVKSAFAGCALVDMNALRHPRCRWDTRSQDYTGMKSLAEHVIFCDRLATLTGKRIVVAQDVNNVYRAH